MRFPLIAHPDTPSRAATGIDVSCERQIGLQGTMVLALDYRIYGRVRDIELPPAARSGRADRLWEHTCFEAFVRERGKEAYVEINLATSDQWAAYRFDSYRQGMRNAEADLLHCARFDVGMLQMAAVIDLDLCGEAVWELSLAAITEETGGAKSYWALTHPPGKPDFHHPDCFVIDLPPPASP